MAHTAVQHIDQVAVRQFWMVGPCVQNVQNNVTSVWQCSAMIKKKHFIYIARHSLRRENKFPFRKCSMSFTVHMLQYYWINSKVLLQKCPVNFTVNTFLWQYWDHNTAVFQKWSVALKVFRILWVVNTYCTPNRVCCCVQWSIS